MTDIMANVCPKCGTPMASESTSTGREVCPDCGNRLQSGRWHTVSMALKTKFAIVVVCIVVAAAIVIMTPPPGPVSEGLACPLSGSLCLYFLCLCMCGSVPDPAARRSILAVILIPVLGTFVVAFGWQFAWLTRLLNEGDAIGWLVGLGTFAVYFSAIVFLIRFYALIAGAFGNRRLRFEWHVALFAAPLTIAANVVLLWLLESFERVAPQRRLPSSEIFLAAMQLIVNFGVAIWYAILLWRTFRTIDVGRLVPSRSRRHEDDYDDASLG
jgi:uncharacterized protein (DUF983 family)